MTKRLMSLVTAALLALAVLPPVTAMAGAGAVSAAYGGGSAAYHGEGFTPDANYVVRLVKTGERALVALCHVKTDSEGGFDAAAKVGKLAPGVYSVYVNLWSGALAAEGSLTVTGVPDSALLKSLSVNGYTLSPTFSPDVNDYTLAVGAAVTAVTISAEAESAAAQVTGNIGNVSLNAGINTFSVTVKTAAGAENTYRIAITRAAATFQVPVKSMLAKVAKLQQIPYTYDGPGTVTFTSSNPAVCAVTADGVLVPMKAGIAVITVSAPGFANIVFAVTVSA